MSELKAARRKRQNRMRKMTQAQFDERHEAIEKRVNASRKKGEARRALKKKFAKKEGVNPRRIALLGGENYTVRKG